MSWVLDLRYAARRLWRPGARRGTLLAWGSLAVGIGAACSVFTAVNAVLLRPPAYDHPERVVVLWESNLRRGKPRDRVSPSNYRDWSASSHAIEALALWEPSQAAIRDPSGSGEPEQVPVMRCTSSLFRVLGARPLLGRTLGPADDEVKPPQTAVISHRLWIRRYGGDSEILQRSLVVGNGIFQIVGVMPRNFQFPPGSNSDLWITHDFPAAELRIRAARRYRAVGRLALEATIEMARREMDAIAARLADEYPSSNDGWTVTMARLQDVDLEQGRNLLVLLGCVGVVVLLASLNAASLLLGAEMARSHEIEIRLALGAPRWRLIRDAFAGAAVLAAAGGVAGLGFAALATPWVFRLEAGRLVREHALGIDYRVFLFCLTITSLTAMLAVLGPASWHLRASSARAPRPGRWRANIASRALVTAQIALTVVLVTAGGLLLHSFLRLWRQDLGFRSAGVLVANFNLPSRELGPRTAAFYETLLERLRASPGVIAAAGVTALPMNPTEMDDFELPFQIEGDPQVPAESSPRLQFRAVTPGYFAVAGIPLLAGRDILASDGRRDGPRRGIINQALARRYFAGRDPIGRRIQLPFGGWHEIVGVVADVRFQGLDAQPVPELFVPHSRSPYPGMNILVRVSGDPQQAVPAVQAAAKAADRNVPIARLTPLDELVRQSAAVRRFAAVVVGTLGVIALLLSFAGSFALLEQDVLRRSRELGVRLALGAAPSSIVRMVVGQGLALASIGTLLGVAAAALVTDSLSPLLFQVSSRDPLTFAAAAALQGLAAGAASLIPARRAAGADPLAILRSER